MVGCQRNHGFTWYWKDHKLGVGCCFAPSSAFSNPTNLGAKVRARSHSAHELQVRLWWLFCFVFGRVKCMALSKKRVGLGVASHASLCCVLSSTRPSLLIQQHDKFFLPLPPYNCKGLVCLSVETAVCKWLLNKFWSMQGAAFVDDTALHSAKASTRHMTEPLPLRDSQEVPPVPPSDDPYDYNRCFDSFVWAVRWGRLARGWIFVPGMIGHAILFKFLLFSVICGPACRGGKSHICVSSCSPSLLPPPSRFFSFFFLFFWRPLHPHKPSWKLSGGLGWSDSSSWLADELFCALLQYALLRFERRGYTAYTVYNIDYIFVIKFPSL